MTVIAYRNGIMACDSCWANGDVLMTTQKKIFRLSSGALFGMAGDADQRSVIKLFDKITSPSQMPSAAAIRELRLDLASLLVLPSGKIFQIYNYIGDKENESESGVIFSCALDGCSAVGSGGDFAMAAMLAHKSVTAAQACKVACRLALNCKPPIHAFKL